jgi:hypothetical protein
MAGLRQSARPVVIRWTEFFKMQLCGFPKVSHRVLDGFTLAHRAHFRAISDIEFAAA